MALLWLLRWRPWSRTAHARTQQDLMAADGDLTFEEAGAILAEVAPAGHARRLSLDEVLFDCSEH